MKLTENQDKSCKGLTLSLQARATKKSEALDSANLFTMFLGHPRV